MDERVVPVRRESGEVHAQRVLLVVAGWLVFVATALMVLLYVIGQGPRLPAPKASSSYPAPRLVTHPEAELPPYLRTQERALIQAGNGHRSLDRAMSDVVKRADPYGPPPPAGAGARR